MMSPLTAFCDAQSFRHYDHSILLPKALINPFEIKKDNEITVKHAYYCLPFKRHSVEISEEI